MLSSQLPFTHRSNESIPINQSGDGTIRDINETWINNYSDFIIWTIITIINTIKIMN